MSIQRSDEQHALLTVNEACHQLQLSRPTVYGLINSGELRSLRFGRARRIPMQAIDELIAARLTSNGSDAA